MTANGKGSVVEVLKILLVEVTAKDSVVVEFAKDSDSVVDVAKDSVVELTAKDSVVVVVAAETSCPL